MSTDNTNNNRKEKVMNVWEELTAHAMRSTKPTGQELKEMSEHTGIEKETLSKILHHLTMAEFHGTEAAYGSARLNRIRERDHRHKAVLMWSESNK